MTYELVCQKFSLTAEPSAQVFMHRGKEFTKLKPSRRTSHRYSYQKGLVGRNIEIECFGKEVPYSLSLIDSAVGNTCFDVSFG
jgi:hypothetical protein